MAAVAQQRASHLLSRLVPRSPLSRDRGPLARLTAAAIDVAHPAAPSSWPVTRRLPAPDTPRSTTRPRTGATARQRILLLDGCDYEHWLIVMEFPEDPKPSEDEMIGAYFKTLAAVVGSEEEAKTRIYSVSTTTYTGFGALISEELSYKVKGLPGVLWVLPDSYLDVPNKDYGGDLFVDGKVIHRPQFRFTERQQTRTRPRPRYDRRRETMQVERREPMMRGTSWQNQGQSVLHQRSENPQGCGSGKPE